MIMIINRLRRRRASLANLVLTAYGAAAKMEEEVEREGGNGASWCRRVVVFPLDVFFCLSESVASPYNGRTEK